MQDNGARAAQLARLFHETYERLAPEFGYRTREASAVPWAEVPDANRSLMIATADAILANGAAFLPDAAELSRLRAALTWALDEIAHPRYEGRHRIDPRCHVFMPIDADCTCGYREFPAQLAKARAALQPEGSAGTAARCVQCGRKYTMGLPHECGHVCTEACLHDCSDCGHEVDHTTRFHAPGCTAFRAAEGSARDGGREWMLDQLISSGRYREAFMPDGERVAVHIETERIARGSARDGG